MNQPKMFTLIFDKWLLLPVLGLILLGLTMVASSSIFLSHQQYHFAFHYLFRQMFYLGLSFICAIIVVQLPLKWWQSIAGMLVIGALILLALVLIPGIGHMANGSRRWLGIGSFGFQASEAAKLFTIIYLADYLTRRGEELRNEIRGFLKPMLLLGLMAILLLKEPDFGTAVVLISTALGMMFLAGVSIWQFLLLLGSVSAVLVGVAFASPYRLARLTSFLNPWSNQFDTGYQLTQSLIAFGRGGWFGVGLGESIQKLFYLPEAHTDFLFAVMSEELGLLGAMMLIVLFVILVIRSLWIGQRAKEQQADFAAYLAYGLGLWIGLQFLINLGVNLGVLPTKGLTLPLISYGGNSELVMGVVIALLCRIYYETNLSNVTFFKLKEQHEHF